MLIWGIAEEERESLTPYLPPIEDEETFKDIIRELLGGENFHFSSPMDDLFERLKGGLCHPRVLRYREGLKYLERKEHYHLMRQYHNHMVSLFVEMQKKWERCPDADLDERLEVWEEYRAQPPPLPKSKRVVRKPGTVRRVKGVPEGSTKKKVPEGISRTKILKVPKKGKLSLKSRKETGALAPVKTKAGVPIPTIGSKGVLRIKTLLKDCLEGSPKRLADLDQFDKVEKIESVRDSKPGPKGVLKLVAKGKSMIKKTSSLIAKRKEPLMEIKREVVEITRDDDEEEEPLEPVEPEVVAVAPVSVSEKLVTGEGFGENKVKRKPTGKTRKRKTLELGGEVPAGEKIAVRKKKRTKEPNGGRSPTELPELPFNEVLPHEDCRILMDKGKNLADPKKKPQRKKKIEEIPREPVEMVVEVNMAIEDEVRPSDDMYELPGEVGVEEDQSPVVKEEVDAKPLTKKRGKKKPRAEKVSVPSPAQSSPRAGKS